MIVDISQIVSEAVNDVLETCVDLPPMNYSIDFAFDRYPAGIDSTISIEADPEFRFNALRTLLDAGVDDITSARLVNALEGLWHI